MWKTEVTDEIQLQIIKRRFKDRVSRLLNFLSQDISTPKCILANEVNLIWKSATLLFGKELYQVFAEHQILVQRDEWGLCQECDSEIPAEATFRPICKDCEVRITKIMDEMDKGDDFSVN